ncbi:galactoside alpha-(1,2)-fucosyltransferase 1-like [Tigriopus californicus]|uniref:galactoside alpha-(1,2)-fucosyltransferase 1-like n=1 Tax=Tigriopus californicus TaxID=6832 RepID=UPI0027DA02B1|nr:galactoside alpha-(1,2)-fucosyltransferase 1-like [Tigriopus californicus]
MSIKNPWNFWLICLLILSALYLFPIHWTREQMLTSQFHHGPQPSFHFMDCGNFCIPWVQPSLHQSAALDNKILWQLKHVNTLARFPIQYQSSIEALRRIRANYVRTLKKSVPNNFGINRHVNKSLQRLQEAGYSCPCTNLVSINENGRLGNKMSQYMTLLGQSKRLHFRPIIQRGMSQILSSIFPRLSVPSQDIVPCTCNWTIVHMNELCKIKSKKELFARGQSIFIPEFPTQIEIFEQFFPTVMREFAFNQRIMQEVQTYLDQVKRGFRSRIGINQNTEVTVVGVHNRRTDYASYLSSKVQGRLLSTRFF